jgi:hypothetical protein
MIEDSDSDNVPGLKEMAGGQALDGVVPMETDLLYYEDKELDEAVLRPYSETCHGCKSLGFLQKSRRVNQ